MGQELEALRQALADLRDAATRLSAYGSFLVKHGAGTRDAMRTLVDGVERCAEHARIVLGQGDGVFKVLNDNRTTPGNRSRPVVE